ncbi:NitT/TauT family transport system substrate-binding protein [Saccharothrix ecbatanensis]|uniref:Thiamine pyrimidine synthase n=1 Tax=Saccharothrix ecbatanensis TaxID=1105145 RepID=A0A7W9HER8_9PSEU|nr:ABC transporter substrate-binding protein [Saccharothrix ecbatanensis]MBB5800944.1 NitT/TauT family transport system substrate-binding protein [Saccharothrix ecbatanensis]
MKSFSAVLLVIAMAATGCGGSDGDSGSDDGSAGLDKVAYLTSFSTFGRDAYAYVALEKGYFAEAGLDVTITPGTGSVDVLKLVASGRADFGIADFTATAITVAKEKLPVTAVAAIHQRSLAAIVSLEGNGISKPADLVGKKIGDQPGSTNQVMFPVYAKAAGIDPAKVEFVPSAPPSLPQLLAAGQVDGIGQFVVGKPLIEAAVKGRKVVVLPYGDLVPDLYGNALVTSKELAADDPERVRRFTGALLKGLAYSIEHPDELGRILKKHQPTQDAGVAGAEVTLMGPYVKPSGFGGPVGELTEARVEKIIGTLVDAGAVPDGSVKPGDVVSFGLVPKP